MWMLRGDNDGQVGHPMSQGMFNRMQAQGGTPRLTLIPGMGHGGCAGKHAGHIAGLSNPGSIRFEGLLPGGEYRLAIFSYRQGKDGTLDRLTRYTVGSQWQDLDITDNHDKEVVFSNVITDNQGNIVLDVAVSPDGTGRFA